MRRQGMPEESNSLHLKKTLETPSGPGTAPHQAESDTTPLVVTTEAVNAPSSSSTHQRPTALLNGKNGLSNGVQQLLVILLLCLAISMGAFIKITLFPQGYETNQVFAAKYPEIVLTMNSFAHTLDQLHLQTKSLEESTEILGEQGRDLKKKITEAKAEAEERKRKGATGKRKLSPAQSALRVVINRKVTEFKNLKEKAKEALDEEFKQLAPPPAVSTIRAQIPAVGAWHQPIPGDSRPGPAYVPKPDPWADDDLSPEQENTKRKEAVVDALKHSWEGYVKHAWGKDELQPQTKDFRNWNEASRKGMGLTILDAMTTMHLMGLEEELEKALEWVRTELTFNIEVDGSAFESTIRALGGLLSIYELTGEKDKAILGQAVDLADRLMWVFNTSSGLPHSTVNFRSKHHFNQQWAGGGSILSEFGTMQLEFRTLSYHTKNPVYDMKVTHAMAIILSKAPKDMLCPTYMSSMHLRWMTDHISIGALGDSFYEYLLKQYLLTGKTEERYKDAYLRAAHAIMDKLVFYSKPSNQAYIAEYRRRDFYHKMDHLACFAAGMLGFGAHQADDEESREETMKIAKELTKTCTEMYTKQQSGVSPEYVEFIGGKDFTNGAAYYILRPEAMEAVFYMWRLTKDQHWRDVGWKMFAAINRWCRRPVGYAGLQEVNTKEPNRDNLQQSFWFAETLKYSFLLFADDSTLNLDEWVLNTEGHPLKIRKRDPMDIWRAYEEEHDSVAWYPPPGLGINYIETERMKSDRSEGKVKKPTRDPKGDEFEDGMVDDEGMPFDPVNGMKGIKRSGVKPWVPPKKRAGQEEEEDDNDGPVVVKRKTKAPTTRAPEEEEEEEQAEQKQKKKHHQHKEDVDGEEISHKKVDHEEEEEEEEDRPKKKEKRVRKRVHRHHHHDAEDE